MKISFLDIHYSLDFKLSVDVRRSDFEEERLYFYLPENTKLDDEIIALAFSTLCGKRYQEIYMDLAVSCECKRLIESFCSASFSCKKELGEKIERTRGHLQVLNFSGGFDSLAAKSLLPKDTALISLDFGGKFSRERVFFERYETNIIKTNLVDLGLNKNHWSFMAIGMIFLRERLSIKIASFGSIMASSIPRIIKNAGLSADNIPQLSYLDVKVFNPLAGVTEIGALSIAVVSSKEVILDSLKSLANPKEGKFFRKSLALKTFCDHSDIFDISMTVPKPRGWYLWGESYADDLSALYVLKKSGREPVEQSYSDGIPDSVIDKLSDMDLDFHLKYNPEAYSNLDFLEVCNIFGKLASFGVFPYKRKDYRELEAVNNLLQK